MPRCDRSLSVYWSIAAAVRAWTCALDLNVNRVLAKLVVVNFAHQHNQYSRRIQYFHRSRPRWPHDQPRAGGRVEFPSRPLADEDPGVRIRRDYDAKAAGGLDRTPTSRGYG